MKLAVAVSNGSTAETASHRGEQRTHSDTRGQCGQLLHPVLLPAFVTCIVGVGRWVGG